MSPTRVVPVTGGPGLVLSTPVEVTWRSIIITPGDGLVPASTTPTIPFPTLIVMRVILAISFSLTLTAAFSPTCSILRDINLKVSECISYNFITTMTVANWQ